MAGVKLDGARRDRAVRTGYAFTYVSFGLLTACIGVILVCMLTENYSLAYVVSNYPATDSPLQPLYRVSAVWAGRQGSLLLWTWLIAAFGAAQAHARRRAKDDLTCAALGVTEIVVALFTATLVFSASNLSLIHILGSRGPALRSWRA